MSEETKPLGVVAVLTNKSGAVVAHAGDFERQGYGGFKLWEAQRRRAKQAAIIKYVQEYTYGEITGAIDTYAAERIVEKLLHDKKLIFTFVNIGHEDAGDQR